MAMQEGYSFHSVPLFDGTDYTLWSIRMSTYLKALGFDVWQSVVNGYAAPDPPPIDEAGIRASENNAKAKYAIVRGISDSVLVRVMHCVSAKEMWDKLQKIYGGDARLKEAKIDRLNKQFWNLKMKNDENVAAYLHRVDEIVNRMRFLGKTLKDDLIVQQVLCSLPYRFRHLVFAIPERPDFDKLKIDDLNGILIAHEMRAEDRKQYK